MGLFKFLGGFRRTEPAPEPEVDLDSMTEDEAWSLFDKKFRELIDHPELPERSRRMMLDALPESERNSRAS